MESDATKVDRGVHRDRAVAMMRTFFAGQDAARAEATVRRMAALRAELGWLREALVAAGARSRGRLRRQGRWPGPHAGQGPPAGHVAG